MFCVFFVWICGYASTSTSLCTAVSSYVHIVVTGNINPVLVASSHCIIKITSARSTKTEGGLSRSALLSGYAAPPPPLAISSTASQPLKSPLSVAAMVKVPSLILVWSRRSLQSCRQQRVRVKTSSTSTITSTLFSYQDDSVLSPTTAPLNGCSKELRFSPIILDPVDLLLLSSTLQLKYHSSIPRVSHVLVITSPTEKSSPFSKLTSVFIFVKRTTVIVNIQHINFTELRSATSVSQGPWSLIISLVKSDEKRIGFVFIALWTRHGNVGGWSIGLNSTTAYPSATIKLSSLIMEVKCPRTRALGISLFDQDTLVKFPTPLSNQVSIHSSSSSSLSRTYATASPSFSLNNMLSGLVEIHIVSRIIIVSMEADRVYLMDFLVKSSFSMSITKDRSFIRQSGTSNTRGTTTQESEYLALRHALLIAENLELSTLKMLSDNSTLFRAINNDIQSKEIYGIVKDIQKLSSGFVDISFLQLRRCIGYADCVAKTTLEISSVMDPIWVEPWA